MFNQVIFPKKTRNYAIAGLISAVTLISGCATVDKNASLERAKGVVADVKNDPAISQNISATEYLAQADEALAKSKHTDNSIKLFRTDDDPEDVDHWAYIAEQKALMAKASLQSDADKEELAKLKLELEQAMVAKQERDAVEANRLEEERLAQEKLDQQREAELQAALVRAEESGAEIIRSEGQIKVTFRTVTFESNKASLKSEFESELANLAGALSANYPNAKLVVRGHSDATGSDAYNLSLSEKRAISVKTFLIGKGVEAERVSSEGLGESAPVASNDTPEGRAKNRRVELIIND